MLRTDLIACQLFSETEAGSDLAAVRTRAVERDDGTGCSTATRCGPPARRSPTSASRSPAPTRAAAKHAGLTVFLVPMDAPGVTVRPIRQMTGGSSFNEVYLDGVELSDDLRLGPVGQGWKVALTVLAAERLDSATSASPTPTAPSSSPATSAARSTELERDRVADLVTRSYVQRLTGMRVAAAVVSGQDPGPEASVGKLLATDTMARTSEVARMLLGPELAADTGRWGTWAWTEHLLGAPGYRIAGGTDEIQHNILAERVLGLPREPRA